MHSVQCSFRGDGSNISWIFIFTSHYQLVDRVFDESLNFKKIPPVISTNSAPEVNGKPVELRPRAPDSLEPRALRRRTWNREEVGPADLQGGELAQMR